MSSDSAPQGKYLRTGWRVVGSAAESVLGGIDESSHTYVEPGRVEDTLYAVQFTFEPQVRGRPVVESILDAVLDDVRRSWPECPRLRRDEPLSHPPSRFGGVHFDFITEPGQEWIGELIWREVHPVVAGAPITTRLVIEERPAYVRVSIRVTADGGLGSVRGLFGAGHAQPSFFKTLRAAEMTPSWFGAPLAARYVEQGRVPHLVQSILSDPERKIPVVVLAPLEEGGYMVPPDDLAWELLGRARLYVLKHHPQTYELTDTVGDRRMSCFRGAARAYHPGWTRHDDPYDHPLLLSDRLGDPVMRAIWLGELGVTLGTDLQLPEPLPERKAKREKPPQKRPSGSKTAGPVRTGVAERPTDVDKRTQGERSAPSAATRPAADGPKAELPTVGPTITTPIDYVDPAPLIESLAAEIRSLHGAMSRLTDEVERLRTSSAVRSSSTNAIERRLGRLEDILEAAFPSGDEISTAPDPATETDGREEGAGPDDDSRPSLVEVVQDVADSFEDELAFLDSAYSSAADSPYEDPERVRAILEAMGGIARRRRDGVLGTSLREAFADLGIDYRGSIARSTSARLREQYRFSFGDILIEAEEHIVLGNTYNPKRCLRVYFTSRLPSDPRFIVAHVGRHFEVKSSS